MKKIYDYMEAHPQLTGCAALAAKGLEGMVYAAYLALCLNTWFYCRERMPETLLVPMIVFVSGSIIRHLINAPRPFEELGFGPLKNNHTKGYSFPSRHAFSAAVIAVVFGYHNMAMGLMMGVVCAAICICRVALIIHWPKDVIAGCLYGVLGGMLLLSLIV